MKMTLLLFYVLFCCNVANATCSTSINRETKIFSYCAAGQSPLELAKTYNIEADNKLLKKITVEDIKQAFKAKFGIYKKTVKDKLYLAFSIKTIATINLTNNKVSITKKKHYEPNFVLMAIFFAGFITQLLFKSNLISNLPKFGIRNIHFCLPTVLAVLFTLIAAMTTKMWVTLAVALIAFLAGNIYLYVKTKHLLSGEILFALIGPILLGGCLGYFTHSVFTDPDTKQLIYVYGSSVVVIALEYLIVHHLFIPNNRYINDYI